MEKSDAEWILENIPFETEGKEERNGNSNVSGNGGCEQIVKSKSIQNKHQIINGLEQCNYRTSPKKIALLLEELFIGYPSTKENHWLYIAQHWPPRAINRVIKVMIKQHQRGERTIGNAAAYFTFLIKKRKKRKDFMATNGIYKQHEEKTSE